MCCLFGLMDHRGVLTVKQKNRMLSVLATAAEVRGTDATGIAYNSGGKLCIYKRPWPGHFMHFRVPADARVIIGHTRMTTQGSAMRSCNNHPFPGRAGAMPFALAHNGMIHNDLTLRRELSLPSTRIETDSYIAAQLLEKKRALTFDSLRYMAEQVQGSFCFTVLDAEDTVYFVKGDNPLCIYRFQNGLYIYASTESILKHGLQLARMTLGKAEEIDLLCSEILRVDQSGREERSVFNDAHLFRRSLYWPYDWHGLELDVTPKKTHLDDIKSVAKAYGYAPEQIDRLSELGFTTDELEELLYCGEL